MLKYKDPVYDESIIEAIPDEFKGYTLRKLIRNRIEVEHFREFLAENYASMDLLCWMDVEAFQRINDNKKRDEKAKEFKNKYMNRKYFFGNNSPAGKAQQDAVCRLLLSLLTIFAIVVLCTIRSKAIKVDMFGCSSWSFHFSILLQL